MSRHSSPEKWEEFIGLWMRGKIIAHAWSLENEWWPTGPDTNQTVECMCPMTALGLTEHDDAANTNTRGLGASDPKVVAFAQWFDHEVDKEVEAWNEEHEADDPLVYDELVPRTQLELLGRSDLIRNTIMHLSVEGYAPEGYDSAQANSDVDRITTGIEAIL
jgi:hypothetical protein